MRIFRSHRLRTHRGFLPGGCYAVTKALVPRIPLLTRREGLILEEGLRFRVERGDAWIGAFVLMPDHLHLCVSLSEDWTLSGWMHSLMTRLGHHTRGTLKRHDCRWQEGFFDVEVRSEKHFDFLVDYIHDNPVRRGLVRSPEDWHTTSARAQEWIRV